MSPGRGTRVIRVCKGYLPLSRSFPFFCSLFLFLLFSPRWLSCFPSFFLSLSFSVFGGKPRVIWVSNELICWRIWMHRVTHLRMRHITQIRINQVIHAYVYTHMCIHTYIYIRVYVYPYIHKYIYISLHKDIRMCRGVETRAIQCATSSVADTYACVASHIYEWGMSHRYQQIKRCTHMYTHTCVYIHTSISMGMHIHICIHIRHIRI